MCVRPACYLPPIETVSPAREHGARLIRRRNLFTVLELGAIATFLGTVLIWSSVFSGA
jgi:hypothetical protein